MAAVTMDDIPFQVDLPQLLKGLRLQDSDADAGAVRALAAQAQAVARPKAMFCEAYVQSRGDDFVVVQGVRLSSRVLRVNLEQAHRVFPFLATCGRELEDWSNSLPDMLERYWADAIKAAALGAALRALGTRLEEQYSPGRTSVMNPGSLEDWPLPEQRKLFALLGNPREAIGVELSDSFLMIPVKSVSGLRFPTHVGFENCQLCPRPDCPGRRAPYDEALYEKRYRKRPG